MAGLLTLHTAKNTIDVERDDYITTVKKGNQFQLREYLKVYSFIDEEGDETPITELQYFRLFEDHPEVVDVDAHQICTYLRGQLGYNVHPKTLAEIAAGINSDRANRSLGRIRNFLGNELFSEVCNQGILVMFLHFLSGGYSGKRHGKQCAKLVTYYGNPTKMPDEKPKKPTMESDYETVDGYMRLKDDTEFEFNNDPIQKLFDAYDPENPVESLKDIGIRAEDALLELKGPNGTFELKSPAQVNKFLVKHCDH